MRPRRVLQMHHPRYGSKHALQSWATKRLITGANVIWRIGSPSTKHLATEQRCALPF